MAIPLDLVKNKNKLLMKIKKINENNFIYKIKFFIMEIVIDNKNY